MFLLLQVWLLSGYSEVEGLRTCSSDSEKIKIVQTSSFLVASFIDIFKVNDEFYNDIVFFRPLRACGRMQRLSGCSSHA